MGVDHNVLKFLLYAKALGARYTRTATIGRQSLSLLPSELAEVFRVFGHTMEGRELSSITHGSQGYVEALLGYLGAVESES